MNFGRQRSAYNMFGARSNYRQSRSRQMRYGHYKFYKTEEAKPDDKVDAKPPTAHNMKRMDKLMDNLKVSMKITRKPIGSLEYPAKTCKDLKMNYPNAPNGMYFMDPNRGSNADAFLVDCTFTKTYSETCIRPESEQFEEKRYIKSKKDGMRWFTEETDAEYEQILYPASRSQFAFLRMNHKTSYQNVTYNCMNMHAHADNTSKVNTYVKVMTSLDDEVDTSSSSGYRFQVLSDGCSVKDGQWHKTTFLMQPRDLTHLPIIDLATFNTANQQEDFSIDLGPVCFQ